MTEGNQERASRAGKPLTGVVCSAGGDKTVRVDVNRLVKHPRYGKYMRRRTRVAVHDPQNQAAPGDLVEILPCRPISKSKSWRLVRVVRAADATLGPAAGR